MANEASKIRYSDQFHGATGFGCEDFHSKLHHHHHACASVGHFRLLSGSGELPGSWMGWDKDLPPGERLMACFRPFIQHVEISS